MDKERELLIKARDALRMYFRGDTEGPPCSCADCTFRRPIWKELEEYLEEDDEVDEV